MSLLFDRPAAGQLGSLPLGEYGWLYYVICALVFTVAGLICGYFIWRRGHMQTLDAEMEIQLAENELKGLRTDLEREEKELRPEAGEETTGEIAPDSEDGGGPGDHPEKPAE
ncbi:MAG: hypothetical protein WD342_02715 [Verrucomicrobiales bacterium]